MKNNYIYTLLIIGLFVIIGCKGSGVTTSPIKDDSKVTTESGKLTTEKAQNTLSRWVKNGQVTVRGIQDAKDNTAKADLMFTNFKYKVDGFDKNYTGVGTAVFTHYNDGRWVLTGVVAGQGFNSVWWDNLSVEVN